MGLFYLLTLYCAIRAAGDGHSRAWAAAAIVSCAAGMGTKEAMVTAPVVVALWDHVFGGIRPGRTGRVRWGLAAGLAATWFVLAVLVRQQYRGPSVSLDPSIIWLYVRTQAEVVIHYLRLAAVPAPLVFFYDWPLTPAPLWMAWQAALLLALFALTVHGVARRHPAGFLGAWFFLILAPSSSVLPIVTEVAAEHRMYLPLAAVITAVVTVAFVAGKRYLKPPRAAVSVGAVTLAAVVVALAAGTHARNRVYGSAEDLWRDTVAKRPDDARPHIAYGEALARAGNLAEAEAQLQTGTELAPQDAFAHVRLGGVLAQQRKFEPAISHLVTALSVRPDDVDAHRLLAEIRSVRGEDALAVSHYEQALRVVPDDAPLLAGLATVLAESRDLSVRNPLKARDLADRAVSLTSRRDPRILQVQSAAQAACGYLGEAARTARFAAAVAREQGDRALASSLEYRATAYESATRQPFVTNR
jgi:Flp pilus assembly protein TadD